MEKKSYYLVSYCGTRETVVQTTIEYKELLKKIKNYNNKVRNYFYGNITTETKEDGIHVVTHKYKRLEKHAYTITDLLDYTSRYTKEDFAKLYEGKTDTKQGYIPDINILYKDDRKPVRPRKKKGPAKPDVRLSYLPMVYDKDRKYMSIEFIKKCVKVHRNDFGVMMDLANELGINHDCGKEVENLRITIDRCMHQGLSTDLLEIAAIELINKYICIVDDEGIPTRNNNAAYIESKRRIMDVGMFFKYCKDPEKKHSPNKYNEGPTEEMKQQLKKEEEERRVRELLLTGKAKWEQMSLF